MSRNQFFDSDIAFLRAENNKKPTEIPPRLISKYVEGRRVMPPGTPFPGLWRNKNTPYSVEIMDNMSPFSPISITSVMKAAQIGLTAAAENVIGYWMDPMPAEILVCSATDSLLKKWANKRLEPLIDSIGMRHKICSQADLGAKNRRTGDETFSKEYVGGALNMSSARSAGNLRSDSKRILILDELDGAPRLLTTGEGTWVDVAYARTNAWGIRAKILEFSTPTTWEGSLIRERYELGDQRRYIVACPRCGKLIGPLEFKYLRPEFKKGFLHRVWYECPECNRELYNSDKTEMMSPEAGAFWEPSAIPEDPTHRSYQLSALYSPVGMLTWKKLYQIYLAAKGNPEKMRSFVNLYLGEPYRQLGTRPEVERIIQNKGGYREGQIEDEGLLFLTCGVDVQRGAEDGDPKNPARLELEVVGHGALYRTWSILYKVIEGSTTDGPYKGAWAAFYEWVVKGGLTFERTGDGMSFPVRLMLIDSGDGVYYDSIFSFASRLGNTFPSKGFKYLKRRKDEKLDEIGPHNFLRYRAAKANKLDDAAFYEIATTYYKQETYTNLAHERKDEPEEQAPGFCDFPYNRPDKYFDGLTAEEKRKDGFHAGGRRNEPLDCRVMALCARDIFLDARVAELKAAALKAGASKEELKKISTRDVISLLARKTARRRAA